MPWYRYLPIRHSLVSLEVMTRRPSGLGHIGRPSWHRVKHADEIAPIGNSRTIVKCVCRGQRPARILRKRSCRMMGTPLVLSL